MGNLELSASESIKKRSLLEKETSRKQDLDGHCKNKERGKVQDHHHHSLHQVSPQMYMIRQPYHLSVQEVTVQVI